jgi:hypothetical protein
VKANKENKKTDINRMGLDFGKEKIQELPQTKKPFRDERVFETISKENTQIAFRAAS